jgi:hypothetical protein
MARGRSIRAYVGALLALVFVSVASQALAQGVTTQCIVNVAAQGTSDAITSAQLPCGTTTNMVILTAAAANVTMTPTYAPVGSPPLVIVRPNGSALIAGDLLPGYVALLTSTGTSWVLLNPANGLLSVGLVPGTTTIAPKVNGGELWDNNGVLGDSTALPNGITATTQTTGDTTSKVATDAFVATALPSLATSQLYGGTGGAGVAQAFPLGTGLSALLQQPPNATGGLVGYGGAMGNVTGHASLDLPLTGGTLTGELTSSNNPLSSSVPSLVNIPGTSQGIFFNYAALGWELALGTAGSPIITAGPSLKVSRTENVPTSLCNNTFNDNSCNAAIMGISIGDSASMNMQVNGVLGEATTISTNGDGEAVGLQGFARGLSGATDGVAGVYGEGRYDSTAARSYYYTVGGEFRTNNQTATDATLDVTDGNSFNAVLATSSAYFSSTSRKVNAAFLAFADNAQDEFLQGLVLEANCCVNQIYATGFWVYGNGDTQIGGSYTPATTLPLAVYDSQNAVTEVLVSNTNAGASATANQTLTTNAGSVELWGSSTAGGPFAELQSTIPGNLYMNASGSGAAIVFQNNGATSLTLGTANQATFAAHILASSTSPGISSCGSGSPAVAGSDNFLKITAGGGTLTSCVINFGKTWGTAPVCTVSSTTSLAAVTVTTSTTQLTLGATSLTSAVVNAVCGSLSELEPANANFAELRKVA